MMLAGALRKAGVSVESHFYERGAHGFGINPDLGATSAWPDRLDRVARGPRMAVAGLEPVSP